MNIQSLITGAVYNYPTPLANSEVVTPMSNDLPFVLGYGGGVVTLPFGETLGRAIVPVTAKP